VTVLSYTYSPIFAVLRRSHPSINGANVRRIYHCTLWNGVVVEFRLHELVPDVFAPDDLIVCSTLLTLIASADKIDTCVTIYANETSKAGGE
jgi:hypothetical protein